jgi:protein-S-isoprenylcysteine O-methyltransferase Ste14
MEDRAARPNRLPWPPILYALTLLAALGLQRLVPLGAVDGLAARILGGALALIGAALAVAGLRAFRHAGATVNPTAPARVLTTSGVYRITRNPMYLGVVVFGLGLGVAIPLLWLTILAPVLALALSRLAIEGEERHLSARFGPAYDAYRARVRRWL